MSEAHDDAAEFEPQEQEFKKGPVAGPIEIPLINAEINTGAIEGPNGEKGKAVAVTVPMVGLVIGGAMVPLGPVRFVLPMNEDSADELSRSLSKSGIVIADASQLPKAGEIILP